MSFNNCVFMGRITKDLELKQSQGGNSYLRFSIAVDRRSKKDEEKKTDFINCVVFGSSAETIAKYFSKGRLILVQGQMQQESYTAKDGTERKDYSLWVSSFDFCGDKGNSGGGENSGSQQSAKPAPKKQVEEVYSGVSDDGLPF